MGCWNKTCGLTGLPIHAGTPVYVFVLIGQPGSYSGEYWTPVLTPFCAEYDDYGGGENNTGIGLPYILNKLADECINKTILDNNNLDIDAFYESIREGKLTIPSWDGKPARVSFTMMHKSIVDEIFDKFTIKKYVGDGNGNYTYISNTYADFVKDIPSLLESLKLEEDILEYSWLWAGVLPSLSEKHICSSFFEHDIENSHVSRPDEYILEWLKGNITDSDIIPLLSDCLKGIILNRFFRDVRKTWAPGGYEGCQHDAIEGYEILCNSMLTHINQRKKENEDYEE